MNEGEIIVNLHLLSLSIITNSVHLLKRVYKTTLYMNFGLPEFYFLLTLQAIF